MEPADTAQLPMESARCFEKLATHCQQGKLRGRIIWEQQPVYSGPRRWAKGPPFTSVSSRKLDPPREAAKNNLNAAGGLGLLRAWTPFCLNVMSCLLNLDHREMIY